jgi:PAS domain S-box-containing protein
MKPPTASAAYLIAVIATVAAVMLRWLLDPWIGAGYPFVTIFAAVAVAVWKGGYRPAILATVLGLVSCEYLFIEPRGSLAFHHVGDSIGFVLFLATCFTIIGFGEAMRVSQRHFEEVAGQQERLLPPTSTGIEYATQKHSLRALVIIGFGLLLAVLVVGGVWGASSSVTKSSLEFTIGTAIALVSVVFYLSQRNLLIRQRAAEAMAEQRERLRVTLASIGDAVITADVQGCIAYQNAVAESLTGWTQDEAVGKPLDAVFNIVNEKTRQGVENPAKRALREGASVGLANDTVLIRKDGTERPIDDSAAPIRDGEGRVIGCVLVFRDITARRRAEQQLANEKARIESIVNHAIDGIIAIDENGTVEAFNPAAEKLFGYLAEEVIAQNVKMLMPEPFHSEHDGFLANYRGTGQAKIIGLGREVDGRRKDGTTFPMDLAVSEFWLGNRRCFTGIVRDITERKQAEEEVRSATEQLQIVTESLPTTAARCSRDLKYLWVNNACAEYFGLPREGIVGRPVIDVIGPALFEQLRPYLDQVLRGERASYERQVDSRGLGDRWIQAIYTPTFDAEGKPDGYVAVSLDVTERKLGEERLRASEQRLAAEVEAMTRLHALSTRLQSADDLSSALNDLLENAIVASRADFGNIQLYNPQMRALEIVAQRGFGPEFLDHFRTVLVEDGSACAQAMQKGDRIIIEDVSVAAAFEPHRPVAAAAGFRAVQSTPMQNRGGAVIGMLSTHLRAPGRPSERDEQLLDLYARLAADLIERLRMERALKEADRKKDEFLATLAHELRNPLAPLQNALELLRRSDDNKKLIDQARSIMERQVSQMVRLVDDVLDISRITKGKLHVRKECVELADVLNVAIETVRPLIGALAHELTVTTPPDPVHVQADPARLAQVFVNLLHNAAKYTEKAGHIWLSAERRGNEAVVSVRDTGIGIPAEHLPRLFTMFSQVTSALERSQGGLGIGLSLVKGLVELHGGSIEARSGGPGKGSELTVRLPIVDVPIEAPLRPGDEERTPSERRFRILVVDDLRDAADSMAMMLKMAGHETRTAYDGLEAIQSAAAFQPNVILLDVGLPKMNGYEAARHIREQPWGGNVTLVALTGWGQEEDKRRAQEAGFDHHLTKPVKPADLQELLEGILPVPHH